MTLIDALDVAVDTLDDVLCDSNSNLPMVEITESFSMLGQLVLYLKDKTSMSAKYRLEVESWLGDL